MAPQSPKKRRASRQLDDMPNLFDSIDIDFSRDDIAGKIIARHEESLERAQSSSIEIEEKSLTRSSRLRFISFGSGSSGNCAYIGSDSG